MKKKTLVPGLPVIGGSASDPDYMWRVQDIAGKLNVSKMAVYRLLQAGDIKSIRVGRSYRVSNSDLAAYLKRQQEAAAA